MAHWEARCATLSIRRAGISFRFDSSRPPPKYQHVACRVYQTLPPIPRRQAAFRTPRCWHRFAPALTWVRLVVLEMGEGGAEWTSGPSRTFVRG